MGGRPMNKFHRDNLEKLATYLESLPEDYDQFRMTFFFMRPGDMDGKPQDAMHALKHECGTTACAVGHGPSAGIPVRRDDNWTAYCRRVFGVTILDSGDGSYMFGGGWPNCPKQAAKRIRTVLARKTRDGATQ